ncbi:MAG: alpha/beta hydrolase [Nocardiaceae bacterium]|nr:alpha/beta hydrolase [Nocardiaceae bacterium]
MLVRRIAALTAVTAFAVAGCTVAPEARPDTSHPVPAGLERFYSQELDWGSCVGYRHREEALSRLLECTRIDVPIDYDHPDTGTAQIAMSRIRASGDKIGSLIVNPGGPGASGLNTPANVANSAVGRSFDVVGFDPRGVGASTPAIVCNSDAEIDADRRDLDVDTSPAGIAKTEQEERDYAARCQANNKPEVLEHVGTRDVVKDLDVMRAVLGDPKLNFVGFSYGTKIGSDYLAAYPDRVRAMVLDGGVPPGADPVEEIRVQLVGFQAAFDNFARQCAESSDCPLGTDPTHAVARYRALVNPLISKPARTDDGRGLSYTDAITGTQQALYSPEMRGMLTTGLRELSFGRGDSLLALADYYDGRRSDGTYSNMDDAFNAVRCADDPPVTDRARVDQADGEFRKAAPFMDDGRGNGNAALDTCAFWPVTFDRTEPKIPANVPKVVVVSTIGDPATPYQDGVDLAKAIGASLLTYHGTQHTVSFNYGVACIDDVVIAYLVDLTVPPEGYSC